MPFSALSMGSRNHTRYGYADFLQEERPYGFMFRVFPGTHKFLLWGDPLTAAAHARAFQFCGSDGAELLEPLAFKGRRGSGIAGGRCAYRDPRREPGAGLGASTSTRMPSGDASCTTPVAIPRCGGACCARDTARARARRRIRTRPGDAHPARSSRPRTLPSAAQDTYSPEFYTNQSIAAPAAPAPYGDTPSPKVFGTVSPLDPADVLDHRGVRRPPARPGPQRQVLARRGRAVDRGPRGVQPRRVSPRQDAAGSLDADSGARAGRRPTSASSSGIGRFFAAKFRSAALYAVFEKSGSRGALEAALRPVPAGERPLGADRGRGRTASMSPTSPSVPLPHQRGHWIDRLPAIDADIAVMAQALEKAPAGTPDAAHVRAAIDEIRGRPQRPQPVCRHTPPSNLERGVDLALAVTCPAPASPSSGVLHYRHVNQAERYQTADMRRRGDAWHAAGPGRLHRQRVPAAVLLRVQGRDRQGVAVSRLRSGSRECALLHRPARPPRGVNAAPGDAPFMWSAHRAVAAGARASHSPVVADEPLRLGVQVQLAPQLHGDVMEQARRAGPVPHLDGGDRLPPGPHALEPVAVVVPAVRDGSRPGRSPR